MKLALVIRFQNDAHWLNLHLRYMAQSKHLDGVVMINGGSTDGGIFLHDCRNVSVSGRPFDWDFSAQSNSLLNDARAQGYTHVILLDPDEIISLSDIHKLRLSLDQHGDVIYCNRVHFAMDRLHWVPKWSPDITPRAFKLTPERRYEGKVHEVLNVQGAIRQNSTAEIHHFGWITPMHMQQLKLENYDRIMCGLPPFKELPDNFTLHKPPQNEPYHGKHILDPHTIGIHAPFL